MRYGIFLALACAGCSGVATGTGGSEDGGLGGDDRRSSVDTNLPTDGSNTGGSFDTLDGMFRASPTASVTQGSIYGLWAGSANGADVRIRLTPTSLTVAKRCWADDRASGGEVSARVTSSAIQVLESKSDIHANSVTRSYCNVDIKPISIPQCTSSDSDCFTVKGTTLDLGGAALFLGQTGAAGAGAPDRRFIKLTD